jgi:riboflavin kinase / FMN adenylyltransferase
MKVCRRIEDCNLPSSGTVVTMGNFDGIHVGHQTLVRNTVADARRGGRLAVVLTFEPHPVKVLAPERAPRLILNHDDKMEILEKLGLDLIMIQKFDRDFSHIEAEDFVTEYLLKGLNVKKIWIGRDVRFGQRRSGNAESLSRWGREQKFEVGIVEPIMIDGARVSSSRIRDMIDDGRVAQVRPMLGRYHFISGEVVIGQRRGRELGFPTANLAARTDLLPKDGIYATLFEVDGSRLLSVTSIGLNPTFGEGPRTVESFIFDFTRDIYGRSVKLSFIDKIREECKFAEIDALIARIREDIKAARAIFEGLNITASTTQSGSG